MSDTQAGDGPDVVWISRFSSVYHTDPHCSHVSEDARAVRTVEYPIDDKDECSICAGETDFRKCGYKGGPMPKLERILRERGEWHE